MKYKPMMVAGQKPGVTEEIFVIEYHAGKPFGVKTKLTTDWTKTRHGHWKPEDKTISTSSRDYDFEWSKTNEQLYWHNPGGGGDPAIIHVGRFANPDPPYAQIWMAPGVKAVGYVEGSRCEQTRDVADAELLAYGYERIDRPLLLNLDSKRTRNPFEVADGDTDCRYCKFCDDYLPDGDGDLCEHAIWCDDCSGYVYDLPEGHVDIDSGDSEPVRHDEWVSGETDEFCGHKGDIRLRIMDGNVETSDGHEVPIEEAARIIADLMDTRNRQLRLFGEAATPNIIGYRAKILRDSIRIGCVEIKWSEILRIDGLLKAEVPHAR